MTAHDATEAAYKNGYAEASDLHGNTINALLGNIRHLEAELEKVKKERDAAVACLETIAKHPNQACDWCEHYSEVDLTLCMMCDDEEQNGNFKWRGLSLADKTSDKEEKHERKTGTQAQI